MCVCVCVCVCVCGCVGVGVVYYCSYVLVLTVGRCSLPLETRRASCGTSKPPRLSCKFSCERFLCRLQCIHVHTYIHVKILGALVN